VRRLGLATVLIVCAGLPAGASSAQGPCSLGSRDEVVARTSGAVIAARPNHSDESTYRGCLKSVGRWRTLFAGHFDGYGGEDPGQAALGGRYAAVSVFSGDHYNTGSFSIRVVNLRTGHARSPLAVGHTDGDLGPHQYAVTALAVSRYATLGWVAQESSDDPFVEPSSPRSTISGHDSGGTRVLDSGGHDSIAAPRFAGATLHWTHDGEPSQARLGTK
jgi:hypothetical protein